MSGTTKLFIFCGIVAAIMLSVSVSGFRCPDISLYANEDINLFFSCENPNDVADIVRCKEGLGFLRNADATGCVPFGEWKCTDKNGLTPPDCKSSQATKRPHSHLNPNYFWACPTENEAAVLMKCEDGRGFVSNPKLSIFGCVPWLVWKEQSECSDLH